MKTRLGFVSNSSSSSFIVIGNGTADCPYIHDAYRFFGDHSTHKIFNIPETFGGHYEFGWDTRDYKTFADRLNWAALCCYYKEGTGEIRDYKPEGNWTEMLVKVLKEDFKVDHVYINFSDDSDLDFDEEDNPYGRKHRVWGYIDHQSAPSENEDNARMFQSTEMLRRFLYCDDSKISGGNDNS